MLMVYFLPTLFSLNYFLKMSNGRVLAAFLNRFTQGTTMEKMKKWKIGGLFLGAFLFLGQVEMQAGSFMDALDGDSIVKIVAGIIQVPALLTVDNDDSINTKIATGLSVLGVDGKMLYELFKNRENTSLFKDFLYHGPKMMLYGAANFYDYLRLKYPAPVFKDDEQKKAWLKKMKMIQLGFLVMEMVLRGFALYYGTCNTLAQAPGEADQAGETGGTTGGDRHKGLVAAGDNKKIYLNEVADWLELGRLISRFYLLKAQLPTDVHKKLAQDLADAKTKLTAIFGKPRPV